MPKFWMNPWLQLNNIVFPSIVTLWLLMTPLWGKVTCDNFPGNRGKLSHHIQLHVKWYPNQEKHKSTAWKPQLISTRFFCVLRSFWQWNTKYIKLLTIFIWKFAIFWSWQLALWNLGQLAPVYPMFWYILSYFASLDIITNSSLAEHLVSDFGGEISTHENRARNMKFIGDNVRDELNSATLFLVKTLDERETNGGRLDVSQQSLA